MRHTIGYAALLTAVLACDSQVTPTSPGNGASLILSIDSTTVAVGSSMRLIVTAVDQSLAPISSASARVSLSDPAIAEIQTRVVASTRDQVTGRTSEQLSVGIRLRAAGPLTLRVAMGNATDSVSLIVRDETVSPPPVSLTLSIDTTASFAGKVIRLTVGAFDQQTGARVSSGNAAVRFLEDSMAEIVDRKVVPIRDLRTGRMWDELVVAIQLHRPGLLTLRATMGDAVATLRLTIRPDLVASSALVVESFTVVEYSPACVWACPYLAYAPLLRLREPTGSRSVEVVAVEFRIGYLTTGLCRGSLTYGPGVSEDLNGIYDYLWSNDLIFVSLDGIQLEGEVKALVMVREADGTYGQIEATGEIQRKVSSPDFPPPREFGWTC